MPSSTITASATHTGQGDHQSKLQLAALGLSTIGLTVTASVDQASRGFTQAKRDGPFLNALKEHQQMLNIVSLQEQHQQQLQLYARHQLTRSVASQEDMTQQSQDPCEAYISHFMERQAQAQKFIESQHSHVHPKVHSHTEAHVQAAVSQNDGHLLPQDIHAPDLSQSGMVQIHWTPELDTALRQLDAEHSGDWKRIGLRMNLPVEVCRHRLEVLMNCDEGNLTAAERAALLAARERRARREAEIRTKLEKSKFFRQLRQDKKKDVEDYTLQRESKTPRNMKQVTSPTNSEATSVEKENSECSVASGESTKGSKRVTSFTDSPNGKKSKVDNVSESEIEKVPNKSSPEQAEGNVGHVSDDVESLKKDVAISPRQSPEMCPKVAKPSLEPVTCPSGMPDSSGGEEGEDGEEGFGLTSQSPLSEDDHRRCETPGSQKVRYQAGFFFRVTKILPGKRKDSLGFLALPKDISFAGARVKISYELDLDDSWAFFLPSLGPVSRRQESSLGAMASWLSVKHKDMAGSRRNPIDIIIVDRR